MNLVSAKGISVRHGKNVVLQNVTLDVGTGEIITIVGPNGSGKSTLLRTLIGAAMPFEGSLVRKSGLRIGYVPQKLHIDQTLPMSVARFLSLPDKISATARDEAERRL